MSADTYTLAAAGARYPSAEISALALTITSGRIELTGSPFLQLEFHVALNGDTELADAIRTAAPGADQPDPDGELTDDALAKMLDVDTFDALIRAVPHAEALAWESTLIEAARRQGAAGAQAVEGMLRRRVGRAAPSA